MNRTTKGFSIYAPGDMSVGIFPSSWKLEGEFHFDEEDNYKEFIKALQAAFELVIDEPVDITTFEEIKEFNNYLENINEYDTL